MKTKQAKPSTNGHATTPTEGYQLLPVDLIGFSLTNPRKTIELESLGELAQSIKAKGLLQPILVRVVQKKQTRKTKLTNTIDVSEVVGTVDGYELVAGERRLRAVRSLGWETVPAIVRDLTDREVLEVQVIENEQREGVLPLEKADGYARLIEDHGSTVEEIAAKVGKSTSTIRNLYKLRALPQAGRDAVATGKIPPSTAQLIARVPSADIRQKLTLHVLAAEEYWRDDDVCLDDVQVAERMGVEPLSYRMTKELIERSLMIELKGAPFSRKSVDLLPETGSCDACPKRTGNARDEYPDARADVCTSPECYRSKVATHRLKQLEKARKQGIAGEMGEHEATRTFSTDGSLLYGCGWTDLESLWDNGKAKSRQKTYQELIGSQIAKQTVAAVDPKGKLRLLAPTRAVEAELRAAGLISDPKVNGKPSGLVNKTGGPSAEEMQPPTPAPTPAPEPEKKKGPTPHQVQQRAARIAGQVLYEMGANNPDGLEGMQSCGGSTTNCAWESLKLLCLGVAWESAGGDGRELLDLQDGILSNLDYYGRDNNDRSALAPFRSWIHRAEPSQLIGFLLKAFTMRLTTYPGSASSEAAKAFLDWGEMDWEQLTEQARRELSGDKPEASVKATTPGVCRICSCTSQDCRDCVERTGEPCTWVEPDLCSACEGKTREEVREEIEALNLPPNETCHKCGCSGDVVDNPVLVQEPSDLVPLSLLAIDILPSLGLSATEAKELHICSGCLDAVQGAKPKKRTRAKKE